MKRTKKLVSGLLVLMLLAGLMVMPVGAAEDTTEYVVNGNFDDATSPENSWTVGSDTKITATIMKPEDDGYIASPAGGNYLQIQRTGENGNSVVAHQFITGLTAETTYTISMYVSGMTDAPWMRVDYLKPNSAYLETAGENYNPEIRFERNYGNRYYNWRPTQNSSSDGSNPTWQYLEFNFTLPEGGGGIRLNLGNNKNTAGAVALYDGISIKKADNLINWGKFNGNYAGNVGSRFDPGWATTGNYCGYEMWFREGQNGALIANSGGFWDDMGTLGGMDTTNNVPITLEQFVPVRDGQLYRLSFKGKNYNGVADGGNITLNMTFAEDSNYTVSKTYALPTNSSFRTYENYIFIDGNFLYNNIPQTVTEARMVFGADITSRLDDVVLQEAEPFGVTASVSELTEGVNTVSVTGEIVKEAWGGADKATLFVGVYEGNKLTDIEAVSLDCGENDSATATIEDISVTKGEGVKLKAFLWDMKDGIRPLETVTVQ